MKKHSHGFTLIELMITVAIIGILAAIAYPSYVDQVRKSRRTDAQSLLLQAANRQERYYTTEYEYAADMAALGLTTETENGFYDVEVASADQDSFTIRADAKGDQANDICTAFEINQLGEKTANDSDSASSDISLQCW